ncbi:hypothetical protein JD844_014695 [Phrynosoma platyrhinos]|uniref:Uncharacterized protein n=1 Tax=Phrynosoma platyrhinos TaxID=52577 RepID=A0ABQ7SRX8_PHRPL|nr:hypothetical protein JD844_014695 [Phrynosoma platyrhinos]
MYRYPELVQVHSTQLMITDDDDDDDEMMTTTIFFSFQLCAPKNVSMEGVFLLTRVTVNQDGEVQIVPVVS